MLSPNKSKSIVRSRQTRIMNRKAEKLNECSDRFHFIFLRTMFWHSRHCRHLIHNWTDVKCPLLPLIHSRSKRKKSISSIIVDWTSDALFILLFPIQPKKTASGWMETRESLLNQKFFYFPSFPSIWHVNLDYSSPSSCFFSKCLTYCWLPQASSRVNGEVEAFPCMSEQITRALWWCSHQFPPEQSSFLLFN